MVQPNMRFIRNLLYKLKRQYGAKITLYKTLTSDIDPKTGRRTTTRKVIPIKLAIVLPDTLARKVAFEHGYLSTNRKFTYGAQQVDQNQRIAIIDGQDIPKNTSIEIETSIIFENERYVVKSSDRMDIGFGYILTLVRVDNSLPLQILDYSISQELSFNHAPMGLL